MGYPLVMDVVPRSLNVASFAPSATASSLLRRVPQMLHAADGGQAIPDLETISAKPGCLDAKAAAPTTQHQQNQTSLAHLDDGLGHRGDLLSDGSAPKFHAGPCRSGDLCQMRC